MVLGLRMISGNPLCSEIASMLVEIIQQLASPMYLHLLVDMANVGVDGMRRNHQFIRNSARSVSARDEHEHLAFSA